MSAIYLYGFVPPDAPAPPPAVTGLGGQPVRLLPLGQVQAAVSRVPADVLDPAALDQRMADLAWVGEQGLAHEQVVLWFVDHTDIVPARMFTLHSSEGALTDALMEDLPRVAASLRQLHGRREWNLKVASDAATLAEHASEVSDEVARADAAIEDAAPGRRYLLQRSRAEIVKREISGAARRMAGELFDELAAFAERTLVLPLADTDRGGNVVLNAALLVHRDRDGELRAAAESLAEERRRVGLIVSFSGPWAPYRFVAPE